MSSSFKVDFIGIGAPRCATSWIYECLKEHPEICMSSKRETGYFTDRQYRKGEDFYASHFKHCNPDQRKGSSAPVYIDQEGIPQRIKEHNPEVKLYVSLRNPIERAYSSYSQHRAKGERAMLFDFKEALEEMSDIYVRPGLYYSNLKRYFDLFARENIKILIYDDIQNKPEESIQELFSFLEVDSDFTPEVCEKRVNLVKKGQIERRGVLKGLWSIAHYFHKRRYYPVIGFIYNFLRKRYYWIWNKVKRICLDKEKAKLQKERPPMSSEAEEYLGKIYKPEISKLEQLINRDLNHWKNER